MFASSIQSAEPVSLRISENRLLSSTRPSSSPGLFLTKREREEERGQNRQNNQGDRRNRLSSGGLLPRVNRKKNRRQTISMQEEGT